MFAVWFTEPPGLNFISKTDDLPFQYCDHHYPYCLDRESVSPPVHTCASYKVVNYPNSIELTRLWWMRHFHLLEGNRNSCNAVNGFAKHVVLIYLFSKIWFDQEIAVNRVLKAAEWPGLPPGQLDQGVTDTSRSVCEPALLHCMSVSRQGYRDQKLISWFYFMVFQISDWWTGAWGKLFVCLARLAGLASILTIQ